MRTLLYVDFPYGGPFGEAMTDAMRALAVSITAEPGLAGKVWTESPETGEAGGVYQFQTRADAEAYLQKHTTRLREWGIPEVRAKLFTVNEPLSALSTPKQPL